MDKRMYSLAGSTRFKNDLWRKQKRLCLYRQGIFMINGGESMLNSTEEPTRANGGIVGDWWMIAFVLVLYVSISYFIHINYNNTVYDSLFTIFIYVVILFFDQCKVSIDNEKVSINHPILKSIIIQKYNINGIKSVDNNYYGISKFFIMILFFFILFNALLFFDMIIHSTAQERIESLIASSISTLFILILILYQTYPRSHYSKYLKIDAGNKKIEIYPGNEEEFNTIMEKLKGV